MMSVDQQYIFYIIVALKILIELVLVISTVITDDLTLLNVKIFAGNVITKFSICTKHVLFVT